MLAAGIVQDTFAGEAGEGEREAKWRRLEATSTTRAGKSSRFVAIEFLSQITNTRMRIRNERTYTYIDDYGGGLASLLNFYRKSLTHACVLETYVCTVLPALRANSCIAIDRLMIELLDFHIPFLSFTNAGFKGYVKNLLNRRLRITQLP